MKLSHALAAMAGSPFLRSLLTSYSRTATYSTADKIVMVSSMGGRVSRALATKQRADNWVAAVIGFVAYGVGAYKAEGDEMLAGSLSPPG